MTKFPHWFTKPKPYKFEEIEHLLNGLRYTLNNDDLYERAKRAAEHEAYTTTSTLGKALERQIRLAHKRKPTIFGTTQVENPLSFGLSVEPLEDHPKIALTVLKQAKAQELRKWADAVEAHDHESMATHASNYNEILSDLENLDPDNKEPRL